ncbi:MAG: hypothetical protein HY553_12700 [Elusimicrobia bacterium]|nr:hypothetical protein [Elusimicrobiota bacterium]
MRISLLAALLVLGSSGCALFPRRVRLGYAPSRNVERRPRQTELEITSFLDKRRDRSSFGKASILLEAGSQPIKPSGDPAKWLTQAASAELAAAGYQTAHAGGWKVGGALEEVHCGSGKRTICSLKLEAWVTMKDGWQVLKQRYSGEGLQPPLFGEDPYELSLQEALREAMAAFRRDVERLVP